MSTYDDLIAQADDERGEGLFKEASITYGRALALGGPRDRYCRHQRGACARRVGEQRLQKADDEPQLRKNFLDQAARWLTKAEANLDSALEGASEDEQAEVRLEQALNEEALARFLTMNSADPARRLSDAGRHRDEARALSASSSG